MIDSVTQHDWSEPPGSIIGYVPKCHRCGVSKDDEEANEPCPLGSEKVARNKQHNCDAEIRRDPYAMSGHRETGDTWKCSCGKVYEHVCDEAEGCSWVPASHGGQ